MDEPSQQSMAILGLFVPGLYFPLSHRSRHLQRFQRWESYFSVFARARRELRLKLATETIRIRLCPRQAEMTRNQLCYARYFGGTTNLDCKKHRKSRRRSFFVGLSHSDLSMQCCPSLKFTDGWLCGCASRPQCQHPRAAAAKRHEQMYK